MLLERCAPGDWRDENHFIFVAEPGETRVDVLRLLFKEFVPALFPHAPYMFPRHRWTGADITFRDVGLPMNVHGLFTASYMSYLNVEYGDEDPDDRPVAQPELQLVPLEGQQGAPEGPEGEGPAADAKPPQESSGAPAPGAQKADHPRKAFADQSKAYRGQARAWLATGPSIQILFFRAVLGPIKRFLEMELDGKREVGD